jgi:RNA polymerase sigma-70 factor (ECF subfamily)
MRCLVDGEELALNALMDAWSGPLCAYLGRLLGDSATALDLAQETFVRVYRKRFEFNPKHAFSHWLFTIARNLAKNHFRWKERHPVTLCESPPDSPSASVPSPREHTMVSEKMDALQQAIQTLPGEMREALITATWHGMSVAEIARLQGSTEKAVELRLYRARKLLREALQEHL